MNWRWRELISLILLCILGWKPSSIQGATDPTDGQLPSQFIILCYYGLLASTIFFCAFLLYFHITRFFRRLRIFPLAVFLRLLHIVCTTLRRFLRIWRFLYLFQKKMVVFVYGIIDLWDEEHKLQHWFDFWDVGVWLLIDCIPYSHYTVCVKFCSSWQF